MRDETDVDFILAIDVRLLHSLYAFCFRLRIAISCCILHQKSELTLLSETGYLDKTLVNYANVMGLREDANINGMSPHTTTLGDNGYVKLTANLHTTGNQFSQLAMIFYVSNLACEFPHVYSMQMLPTAKYLGMMVVLVSYHSTLPPKMFDIHICSIDVID